MLFGIGFLVLGALAVAGFALFGNKNPVADRLAAIDASAGLESSENHSLFRRLMDEKDRHAMSRKLQEAGWYKTTPQNMLMYRLTGLLVGSLAGIALLFILHRNGFGYFTLLLVAFAGAYFPIFKLNGAIAARKMEIHRGLPDFLDMLSTTVEAGLGLNSALATSAEGMKGALGDELRSALQDIRLGRSRSDALSAMANRVREPDLTTTITAMIQSERVGASISKMLDQLAAESRERRLMRAEEIAGVLPNKLVFPMALCMLPALFVIIIGGVVARFVTHH
ncbi:MAG: type II secretion system F family protein [Candidatus Baltobacteraceae bacterium]